LSILAQAATALAFAMGGNSSLALAAASLWLLVVPVSALACIRLRPGGWAYAVALLVFPLFPPSPAFLSAWLAVVGLSQSRLPYLLEVLAIIAVVAAILTSLAATVRQLTIRGRSRADLASGWSALLLFLGIVPVLWFAGFVIPATRPIRTIAADSIRVDLLALRVGDSAWLPGLVSVAVFGLLAAILMWRPGVLVRELPPAVDPLVPPSLRRLSWPLRLSPAVVRAGPICLFLLFGVAVLAAILR
jgi:hypothetical protein